MCLPFLCGGRDDHGPAGRHHESPPPPQPYRRPSDGDPVIFPVKHAIPGSSYPGGETQNGGAAVTQAKRTNGPAHPGGGNRDGERAAAVSNNSDADVPSGGLLRGKKGSAEKAATLSTDALSRKEYVPAGVGCAPQFGPVAASQQVEDKMRQAPASQFARRVEDDDGPAFANNVVNGNRDHGGEDDRKYRRKSR